PPSACADARRAAPRGGAPCGAGPPRPRLRSPRRPAAIPRLPGWLRTSPTGLPGRVDAPGHRPVVRRGGGLVVQVRARVDVAQQVEVLVAAQLDRAAVPDGCGPRGLERAAVRSVELGLVEVVAEVDRGRRHAA